MPTLTFYVNDEVAEQLKKVIRKLSKTTGIKVSRGDLFTPHIKTLYKQELSVNRNGKSAHVVGKDQPVAINDQPSTK